MDQSTITKLANKKPHERTEEDWDAVYDAQSLARAEEIKMDEARYERAQLWAAVLLEQEKREAKAMEKVAKNA